MFLVTHRYLLTLKKYVKNRARPEGSIANGYLAEQCLTFCSRYMKYIEMRLCRPERNDDDIVDKSTGRGRTISAEIIKSLSRDELDKAHRNLLFNAEVVAPFLE